MVDLKQEIDFKELVEEAQQQQDRENDDSEIEAIYIRELNEENKDTKQDDFLINIQSEKSRYLYLGYVNANKVFGFDYIEPRDTASNYPSIKYINHLCEERELNMVEFNFSYTDNNLELDQDEIISHTI
jgi:hypothetical protein